MPITSVSRSGVCVDHLERVDAELLDERFASSGPMPGITPEPRNRSMPTSVFGRAQLVRRDLELPAALLVVDPLAAQPQRQALVDADQLADDRDRLAPAVANRATVKLESVVVERDALDACRRA